MVNLLKGSIFKIPDKSILASLDKWLGISNLPNIILLYNVYVSGSSNGKYPHNNANKITPDDQISAFKPSYSKPAIISGGA